MYRCLRSIFFLLPPEWTHSFSMNCLKVLCSIGFIRKLVTLYFSPAHHADAFGRHPDTHRRDSPLTTHILNLDFKNPMGLGAGFDKNAAYLRELETLGFGFVEIGTVTPLPQQGNPKPRLFRLPKDKGLINRMGFNNDGAKVIGERLKKWKNKQSAYRHASGGNRQSHSQLTTDSLRLIIGGNI